MHLLVKTLIKKLCNDEVITVKNLANLLSTALVMVFTLIKCMFESNCQNFLSNTHHVAVHILFTFISLFCALSISNTDGATKDYCVAAHPTRLLFSSLLSNPTTSSLFLLLVRQIYVNPSLCNKPGEMLRLDTANIELVSGRKAIEGRCCG